MFFSVACGLTFGSHNDYLKQINSNLHGHIGGTVEALNLELVFTILVGLQSYNIVSIIIIASHIKQYHTI